MATSIYKSVAKSQFWDCLFMWSTFL